jgi:hypothetical protein
VANARPELIGARLLDESTDATGKFEFRLLPGGYTLSVVPPIGLKPPSREPDNDRVMVWTRTFYPGVSLPEAASKIVAQLGRVISGIELRLQSVPVHAVRGVLLNPDGTPAPKLAITLSEEIGQPAHRAESGSGGAFEFPAVVDGKLAPCGRAGEQRPETAGYAVDRNGGSRTGRCEASSQPAIHGARPSGDGNAQRRASAEHALGFSSRPCGQHRQWWRRHRNDPIAARVDVLQAEISARSRPGGNGSEEQETVEYFSVYLLCSVAARRVRG